MRVQCLSLNALTQAKYVIIILIYRMNQTKSAKARNGRWSKAEHQIFLDVIEKYGKNWMKVEEKLKGRNLSQVRSHAQKYFAKLKPSKIAYYEKRAQQLQVYVTPQIQKQDQQSLKQQFEATSQSSQKVNSVSNAELEEEVEEKATRLHQESQELQNSIAIIRELTQKSTKPKPSFFLQFVLPNLTQFQERGDFFFLVDMPKQTKACQNIL